MIDDKYDAIMIECKDEIVEQDSLVCVSNYDTRRAEWLSGLMEIMPMSEALKIERVRVSKDDNVNKFFEKIGLNEVKRQWDE